MKIMFVTKAFGAGNGAEVGSRMHYEALCNILGSNNVFVVNLREMQKEENANYLCYGKCPSKAERLLRYIQGNTFHIGNKEINDILSRIDSYKVKCVFIDDSIFGRLVKKIKKKHPDVCVISFYHDVKANLYPEWMRKRGLKFFLEGINGLANEQINQKYADYNIVLNSREEQMLLKYYKKSADMYLPVTTTEHYQKPGEEYQAQKDLCKLLFVGTYYYPNVEGLKWFIKEVFEKLDLSFELDIVGKGLEVLKNELETDRIKVHGTVESLEPFYRAASIVVAPIFDGAGMKIKTAEAMSYGKIFVGAPESLIGYEGGIQEEKASEYIVACKTADEFISAIQRLKSYGSYSKVVERVHQKHFSPISTVNSLRTIPEIEKLL